MSYLPDSYKLGLGQGCRVSAIGKFKLQNTNTKWFDKPFDSLTVLSKVEGLTTSPP